MELKFPQLSNENKSGRQFYAFNVSVTTALWQSLNIFCPWKVLWHKAAKLKEGFWEFGISHLHNQKHLWINPWKLKKSCKDFVYHENSAETYRLSKLYVASPWTVSCLDIGRKVNVHMTFRKRHGRLRKVLCTFHFFNTHFILIWLYSSSNECKYIRLIYDK